MNYRYPCWLDPIILRLRAVNANQLKCKQPASSPSHRCIAPHITRHSDHKAGGVEWEDNLARTGVRWACLGVSSRPLVINRCLSRSPLCCMDAAVETMNNGTWSSQLQQQRTAAWKNTVMDSFRLTDQLLLHAGVINDQPTYQYRGQSLTVMLNNSFSSALLISHLNVSWVT